MKFVLTLILLSNVAMAKWDCKSIDSTMSIVSSNGCAEIKYCVGYAVCNSAHGKFSGRIICKADKNLNCPNANECLDEVFEKKIVSVAIQPEKNPNGVYRFCNSTKIFKPIRDNKIDVVNSRFCDTVSGEYDKGKVTEPVGTMTGKEGGGGQMTTAK